MSDDYTPPAPVKYLPDVTIVPAPPRDDTPEPTPEAPTSRWEALKAKHQQSTDLHHEHDHSELRKAKVPLYGTHGLRIGYDILLRRVCVCGDKVTVSLLQRVLY
jgi:hypothetical protein